MSVDEHEDQKKKTRNDQKKLHISISIGILWYFLKLLIQLMPLAPKTGAGLLSKDCDRHCKHRGETDRENKALIKLLYLSLDSRCI